jgi:hypothetical protein
MPSSGIPWHAPRASSRTGILDWQSISMPISRRNTKDIPAGDARICRPVHTPSTPITPMAIVSPANKENPVKHVLNKSYSACFRLSVEALKAYYTRKGREIFVLDEYEAYFIPFHDYLKRHDALALSKHTTTHEWNELNSLRYDQYMVPRNDPDLVAVVEELGLAASGKNTLLIVVDVPDGIETVMTTDNGYETLHEKHRSW